MSELTDAQKKELKIKGGVKVEAVDRRAPRGPACAKATSSWRIGNTEIGSVKEFDAAVAKVDKSKPDPGAAAPRRIAQLSADRPAAPVTQRQCLRPSAARLRTQGFPHVAGKNLAIVRHDISQPVHIFSLRPVESGSADAGVSHIELASVRTSSGI